MHKLITQGLKFNVYEGKIYLIFSWALGVDPFCPCLRAALDTRIIVQKNIYCVWRKRKGKGSENLKKKLRIHYLDNKKDGRGFKGKR